MVRLSCADKKIMHPNRTISLEGKRAIGHNDQQFNGRMATMPYTLTTAAAMLRTIALGGGSVQLGSSAALSATASHQLGRAADGR
jgi:hypothetical protein